MTVLKVHEFDVDAEVQGKIRRVRWAHDENNETGALVVVGLSHTDALDALARLGTGALASVLSQATQHAVANPDPAQPDPVAAAKETGDALRETAKARKTPKAAPPTPADAPQPEPAQARAPDPVLPPPQPDPPVSAPPSATNGVSHTAELAPLPAPAPVHEGSEPDLGLLHRATTVRAVLSHLLERGYDKSDTLLAICEELREKVPVLSRVTNLKERIDRALEVMSNP